MDQLNLLPVSKRQEIRKNINYIEVINSFIVIVLALLAIGLLLFLSQKYLHYRLEGMEEMDNKNVEQSRVIEINTKLEEISIIQDDFIKWSRVLTDFLVLVPDNNVIYNLNFDKNNNKLSLSGWAKTRGDFLKLREALEGSDLVVEMKSPISNLLYQTDVDFSLEADLNF